MPASMATSPSRLTSAYCGAKWKGFFRILMAANFARIKLLAIDDDPQSLELVSEALSDNDLQILTAGDPETALELVHRERPQIVLSDIVMPKMNGMELLGRIL